MTGNQKIDLILQKLGGIEGGFASVGEDVWSLQGDIQPFRKDMQTPKGDVQSLKERVTNIGVTLENETSRDIRLTTERYSNLDHKLDEALKGLYPNTIYHLKVNYLDDGVIKMKRILGMA